MCGVEWREFRALNAKDVGRSILIYLNIFCCVASFSYSEKASFSSIKIILATFSLLVPTCHRPEIRILIIQSSLDRRIRFNRSLYLFIWMYSKASFAVHLLDVGVRDELVHADLLPLAALPDTRVQRTQQSPDVSLLPFRPLHYLYLSNKYKLNSTL